MKKTAAVLAGLLLAFSAGSGVASAAVSAQDLQQMVSSQLAAKAGSPPDSVVCPGDLETNAGASITCQVTARGETRGVTVTVASVEGNAVSFNLSVAPRS